PSWTRGHRFTILQVVTGRGGGAWTITVGNGAGASVHVEEGRLSRPPDAVVSFPRTTFDALLRGEGPPRGERPRVRGDRAAVAMLKAWTDRAQTAAPGAANPATSGA
ncbi:MAG TPA: hypothetical protein VF533_04155, partial [Solirubrobacteraceae bacterium]